jgi:hypothetical protein
MIKHEILHRIEVDQNLEHLPSLRISWPGEVQLGFNVRVTKPVSQGKIHNLRELTGILTESPADKEPHICSAPSGLINMVYNRIISYHFFYNVLEPGMVREPLDTELHVIR